MNGEETVGPLWCRNRENFRYVLLRVYVGFGINSKKSSLGQFTEDYWC